jgi:hypothetical protein
MCGVIRKGEVLRHPILVIRIIGVRGFLQCLMARRGVTFLSLIAKRR